MFELFAFKTFTNLNLNQSFHVFWITRLKWCSNVVVTVPFFAFIYCLAAAYSVADSTTVYTHCLVDNFAISMSETVAYPESSRKLWTGAVLIHVLPKMVLVYDLGR